MTWRTRVRRLLPYVITAAGGFLLAYLIVFFFVFPADLVPDDAPLPAVTGLYYEDAVRRLRQDGFEARRGEQRYHATAPDGVVLEQDPPAQSRQPRGTTVTLATSRGQLEAQVPGVIGLTRQQAEAALTNAGIQLGDVGQRESSAPRGEVIAVEPTAGTTLQLPAAVRIVVSSGPSQLEMPDVVGQSYAQARVFLEQVGLRPEQPTYDPDSYMPEFTVLSQSPEAGAMVSPGARVSLRIAGRQP